MSILNGNITVEMTILQPQIPSGKLISKFIKAKVSYCTWETLTLFDDPRIVQVSWNLKTCTSATLILLHMHWDSNATKKFFGKYVFTQKKT